MTFNIESIDHSILEKLQYKIDQKTKPVGSLGSLEKIALKIGSIQNSLNPELKKPSILIFAADHGIAKKNKVNAFPQEVTAQMVYNFLNKGAAINAFCKQNNLILKVIDAGVNHNFSKNSTLIDAKIARGTNNFENEPAMSKNELQLALKKGAEIVENQFKSGCNCIGFGEMGIGNTSAAALLMASFTKIPVKECVGAGTGLNSNQISKKAEILDNVFQKHKPKNPFEIMQCFGGFEIAMIAGGILKAAELKVTIIIDGFIVTAALLFAQALHKNVLDYCIFSHQSNEQGHQKMLQFLNAESILQLGLRLGEGTGAALCIPIVKCAVAFLNEMASFESAGVSKE